MRRITGVFALTALALAGVFAGVFLPSGGASTNKVEATKKTAAITKVTVKAFEFRYTFSRRSAPTGTIIFTVQNKGKISHDFKIAGKKTRSLAPGKSQVLRVVVKKKGQYAFLCTLFGHAKAGMKGKFAVAVAPVVPKPTTTTQPPPPPPPPPPTGTVGPGNTTVTVGMVEYGFNLSQTSMPSGQVTFVITNNGAEVHNFSVSGIKAGQILNPGQSETYTVGLPAARFSIVCDVPFHIDRGMSGSITVTP